jgi:hypothetical protein
MVSDRTYHSSRRTAMQIGPAETKTVVVTSLEAKQGHWEATFRTIDSSFALQVRDFASKNILLSALGVHGDITYTTHQDADGKGWDEVKRFVPVPDSKYTIR